MSNDTHSERETGRSDVSRRSALQSIAGITSLAAMGIASTPGAAMEMPARGGGGGGGGDDANEVYDQMVSHIEDYDPPTGDWELKLALTTDLSYFGSVEFARSRTETAYLHGFTLLMSANALQRRFDPSDYDGGDVDLGAGEEYGSGDWEAVDPDDGGSYHWQYLLSQGGFGIEVEGNSGVSLGHYGDDKVTAFSPGRGASSLNTDAVFEQAASALVSRAASRIPLAAGVLTVGGLIYSLAADNGSRDPNPLQTDNKEEFNLNYYNARSSPAQGNGYFSFFVKTDQPCDEFDINVKADAEVINSGSKDQELAPVSIRETYTSGRFDKNYYSQDIDAYCD